MKNEYQLSHNITVDKSTAALMFRQENFELWRGKVLGEKRMQAWIEVSEGPFYAADCLPLAIRDDSDVRDACAIFGLKKEELERLQDDVKFYEK